VGLVDQGCRLQRLTGPFLDQPLSRQLAQLIVDERQELLGGMRGAGLDGGQDLRDISHTNGVYQLLAAEPSENEGHLALPLPGGNRKLTDVLFLAARSINGPFSRRSQVTSRLPVRLMPGRDFIE